MQVNIKKYALFGFISIAVLLFILTALLSGPSETAQNEAAVASEEQARSGMYRMRDVTAGTEEVVQLAFSENRLEYSYPFVLDSGRRITIVVGGTTTDGVNYTLCRKRGDEDESPTIPPGCYFRGYDPRPCTFSGRSGSCLIPDGRRGTNRVEYTKL